jgi:hypothetical protein
MKTWTIPVVWQEMGTVTVIAGSLAEAIELAKDANGVLPIPDDGYYLEDSWELATEDEKFLRRFYNGNQEDV